MHSPHSLAACTLLTPRLRQYSKSILRAFSTARARLLPRHYLAIITHRDTRFLSRSTGYEPNQPPRDSDSTVAVDTLHSPYAGARALRRSTRTEMTTPRAEHARAPDGYFRRAIDGVGRALFGTGPDARTAPELDHPTLGATRPHHSTGGEDRTLTARGDAATRTADARPPSAQLYAPYWSAWSAPAPPRATLQTGGTPAADPSPPVGPSLTEVAPDEEALEHDTPLATETDVEPEEEEDSEEEDEDQGYVDVIPPEEPTHTTASPPSQPVAPDEHDVEWDRLRREAKERMHHYRAVATGKINTHHYVWRFHT
jgi:hypothetical protein